MLISLKYKAIILKLTGAYLNTMYMRTREDLRNAEGENEGKEG